MSEQFKKCDICYEVVKFKCKPLNMFAILSTCNHCFCKSCISEWHKYEMENYLTKTCPTCRKAISFYIHSKKWIYTKKQKQELYNEFFGITMAIFDEGTNPSSAGK